MSMISDFVLGRYYTRRAGSREVSRFSDLRMIAVGWLRATESTTDAR